MSQSSACATSSELRIIGSGRMSRAVPRRVDFDRDIDLVGRLRMQAIDMASDGLSHSLAEDPADDGGLRVAAHAHRAAHRPFD
ncbi:hypothetical protein [Burkholderia cepacia]|uniref:hypothetical protein n=1 Tax=Burkholderia cepacia TaxID=292 RepID=UPI0012D9AC29|nr:hypothetical protein [Burkholderia cepacia]